MKIEKQRKMEQQMPDCELFINHVGKHYASIETKLKMLSGRNHQPFDKDAYQEVIIKCYKRIQTKGTLNDKTPYGIESYLIKSYFNFLVDIKRSAEKQKRDLNYNSDNIQDLYEKFYNSNNDTARTKIASDLFKDFSILYIMTRVEDNFDQESFYLFRLKHLCELTYRQVYEKTHIKGARQKILEVKQWLKDNIIKEDIKKAFNAIYGELL